MELQTITEDPHVARRAFLDYRIREPLRRQANEAERELRAIDQAMLEAYRELAAGTTLLRLTETIRAGGMTGVESGSGRITALPNLAIAKATERRVYTTGVSQAGNLRFGWQLTPAWGELSHAAANSIQLDGVFAEDEWKNRETSINKIWSVLTPTVPPKLRPNGQLGGYHVLFEVDEWSKEPVPPGRDPALLKHVGGDLWAVVATWDLTPLEAAVLGQRS